MTITRIIVHDWRADDGVVLSLVGIVVKHYNVHVEKFKRDMQTREIMIFLQGDFNYYNSVTEFVEQRRQRNYK